MIKSNEEQESGIRLGSPESLTTIDDLAQSLSEKDARHLSIALGEEINPDEAEDLSTMFPRDIPRALIEKHNTKSRIKQFLSIPKKLQSWRRKK
jgi:hypothetical protein